MRCLTPASTRVKDASCPTCCCRLMLWDFYWVLEHSADCPQEEPAEAPAPKVAATAAAVARRQQGSNAPRAAPPTDSALAEAVAAARTKMAGKTEAFRKLAFTLPAKKAASSGAGTLGFTELFSGGANPPTSAAPATVGTLNGSQPPQPRAAAPAAAQPAAKGAATAAAASTDAGVTGPSGDIGSELDRILKEALQVCIFSYSRKHPILT